MSEIEKMQRYIERTNIRKTDAYCMSCIEAFELGRKMKEGDESMLGIISLIFNYGKAKGYRAAKAERRAAV